MSIGPFGGVLGSAAGAPLSQTTGSEAERMGRDAAAQDRQVANEKKAEKMSGVGQTEEDQGASERDADGRRMWELSPEEATGESPEDEPRAKDASGDCGGQLDLLG